jgi:formate hydrogenlyase subunit 6/NADH:ubiquinone oxidoreductase subunit I
LPFFFKTRELREALTSLLKRPVTTRFPLEEHHPPAGFRGKPQFDEAKCVGCGACAEVCPASAIRVIDPKSGTAGRKRGFVRKLELRYDACNFCGLCETHCITGEGIRLTDGFDLALLDRTLAAEVVEKELVCCERCGGILTARDHLLWIFRIGDPVPPLPSPAAGGPVRREEAMKLLCPDCRRQVRLKDRWGDRLPLPDPEPR